jgi:serine/threonine protein kinase
MAPEVMKAAPYTKQCDVYSFAMILWEILAGEQPWSDARDVLTIQTAVLSGNRPVVSDQWSPSLIDLLKRCWHVEAAQRPLFPVIVSELEAALLEISQPRS